MLNAKQMNASSEKLKFWNDETICIWAKLLYTDSSLKTHKTHLG